MEFEKIYSEYASKIYRLCLGYVNDHDQAKDLTQDTFIAVWQNLPSFRQEASVGTWIFKIASNKCLRHLEVEKRVPKVEIPFDLHEDHPSAENKERLTLLMQCISQLPELDRLIIGLYLEGVKQSDIAEIMGLNHSNVRVKIHRIKETLTQKFSSNGGF